MNRIAPGQVANIKAAYDTMAGISEAVKRQGYMKAQATFEERIDHERLLVHLDIEIALGTQYRFSRLIVSGSTSYPSPLCGSAGGCRRVSRSTSATPLIFWTASRQTRCSRTSSAPLGRLMWTRLPAEVDVTLLFFGMSDEAR